MIPETKFCVDEDSLTFSETILRREVHQPQSSLNLNAHTKRKFHHEMAQRHRIEDTTMKMRDHQPQIGQSNHSKDVSGQRKPQSIQTLPASPPVAIGAEEQQEAPPTDDPRPGLTSQYLRASRQATELIHHLPEADSGEEEDDELSLEVDVDTDEAEHFAVDIDELQLDERSAVTETERQMIVLFNRIRAAPLYSEAIKKQNHLVLKTYIPFCKALKRTPFPVEARVVVAYLFWLAEYRHYCVSTLDCIVCFALIRLNVHYTHKQVGHYVKVCMRAAVNQLYHDPKTKKPSKGMKPLILPDVQRMIQSIPDSDKRKAMWASLFLFAIATGSRASTCLAVTVTDLVWLRRNPDGNVAVTIMKRKLKGQLNPEDPVTLAGNIRDRNASNFIYWLDLRLRQMGYRSLEYVVECNIRKTIPEKEFYPPDATPESIAETRIWPISVDSMTRAVKRKLAAAGLCEDGYGSHSFRSGMLASILLNYTDAVGPWQNAIDKAAIIGNWSFRSAILERYIKQQTKASIVATDLNGTTNFQQEPITAEDFRQQRERETIPPQGIILAPIKECLAILLYHPDASRLENEVHLENCFQFATQRYGKIHGDLTEEKDYSKRMTEGRRIMSDAIKFNLERVIPIAQELYAILQETGKADRVPTITPEQEREIMQTREVKRSKKESGEKQQRHKWTQEESSTLIQVAQQGGSWNDVALALPHLLQKQCQEHLKFLNRQRKGEKFTIKKGQKKESRKPYPIRQLAPYPVSLVQLQQHLAFYYQSYLTHTEPPTSTEEKEKEPDVATETPDEMETEDEIIPEMNPEDVFRMVPLPDEEQQLDIPPYPFSFEEDWSPHTDILASKRKAMKAHWDDEKKEYHVKDDEDNDDEDDDDDDDEDEEQKAEKLAQHQTIAEIMDEDFQKSQIGLNTSE